MKNTKHILLVLVLMLLGVCGVVLIRHYLPTRFTESQCDHIQAGMTGEQVELVMGVPAGYHAKEPGVRPIGSGPLMIEMMPEGWTKGWTNPDTQVTQKGWLGDEGMVIVDFDRHGKVTSKLYCDVLPPHPIESMPGRLLRRFRSLLP
jgi:hypothetical protein